MGNCLINRSSSSSPVPLAKMDGINCCCDGTIESASYATISPPASPIKPGGDDAIDEKQNEHDLHVPSQHDSGSPNNDIDMKSSASSSIMEQQREDGQNKLRELVISGANAGDIDWKSIIALAEDLHRKEQQLLKSYKDKRLGGGSADYSNKRSGRKNISRRQAFFEKRRRKRELSRRRKLESVGSFSVNLLKYGVEDERCIQREEKNPSSCETICENVSASIDNEYTAMDDDDLDDELHVFEDDNLAMMDHHMLSCESSTRSHFQAKCISDRPSTPTPYTNMSTMEGNNCEGSFMGCFFSSNRDDLSDCSSSCSKSQGGAWDLMTIAEDTTVANW